MVVISNADLKIATRPRETNRCCSEKCIIEGKARSDCRSEGRSDDREHQDTHQTERCRNDDPSTLICWSHNRKRGGMSIRDCKSRHDGFPLRKDSESKEVIGV